MYFKPRFKNLQFLLNQDRSDLGSKSKLRYCWNEKMMQDILQQIRGLQIALTLLLQLLGTYVVLFSGRSKLISCRDTITELKQLLNENTMILSRIEQRTSHFRAMKPSHIPESIFDDSSTIESINSGNVNSMLSSTPFSFDDEIVNSQCYRRVLAKAYANNYGNRNKHNADLIAADRTLDSVGQPSDSGKLRDCGPSLS